MVGMAENEFLIFVRQFEFTMSMLIKNFFGKVMEG